MNSPSHNSKQSGIEGTRLGPYLVGTRLGIGGAAAVYLGVRTDQDHDLSASKEVVAVKVIHDHLAFEHEFVQMFLDEARVALQLVHPNVVRTHEMGQEDDRLYMAMEYLHGQSLHEVFVRGTKHGARLPVDLVAWIGSQVAKALHYAHTLTDETGTPLHLVHRDVSPRNIFIGYDGNVKLIDFGIAQAVGRIAKTKVGQMKGTFAYIAPERARGGACDHRADIFSLAVALYEAGTGQRLFRAEDDLQTLRNVLNGEVPDPGEVREGFPREMARILFKALSPSTELRHQTALELAQELDAFVAACGSEPPKARLALMMSTIFEEDREKKNSAIAAVRDTIQRSDHTPTEPPPEAAGPSEISNLAMSRTGFHAPERPRRWLLFGTLGGGLAAAATGLIVLLTHPFGIAAPPSASVKVAAPPLAPIPRTITIDVSVIPNVEASFVLGGEHAKGTTARFEHPVGLSPVTLSVHAEGFEDAQLAVIPDERRTVVIPLREKPKPEKTAEASSARPRPASRPLSATAGKAAPKLTDLLNKRH